MARKGGNPDLGRHKFVTDREQPLVKHLQIRVSQEMWGQLEREEDWREFVREAIASALKKNPPVDAEGE